jgi:DNA polymerase-3 subunit chi
MADEACEVWFYQLERSNLDAVLPELLEKTLARGWRALVAAPSKEVLDHLDRWLWIYRDDSFLAHGAACEPSASRQPILLSLAVENGNGAQALFLVDGAEVEDISAFARCVTIFDGRDEAALAQARRAWTGFKEAGHGVSYWRQGERTGWEKQAP